MHCQCKLNFLPLKKKEYKNHRKCQNPKFWGQFHPAKHVRIRKTFSPSTSIYNIRQLKNFGFIDKSHFCFFPSYLLYSVHFALNQMLIKIKEREANMEASDLLACSEFINYHLQFQMKPSNKSFPLLFHHNTSANTLD